MSWWGDFTGALSGFIGGESNVAPAVASGAGPTLGIIGAFTALSDGKLWRSVGWILLGVVLILLGAVLLARQSAQSVAAGLARGVI